MGDSYQATGNCPLLTDTEGLSGPVWEGWVLGDRCRAEVLLGLGFHEIDLGHALVPDSSRPLGPRMETQKYAHYCSIFKNSIFLD